MIRIIFLCNKFDIRKRASRYALYSLSTLRKKRSIKASKKRCENYESSFSLLDRVHRSINDEIIIIHDSLK